LHLLQAAELSQLRHELLILERTQRVLIPELSDQELEEILLAENLLGGGLSY
jgi:hypothetical protein